MTQRNEPGIAHFFADSEAQLLHLGSKALVITSVALVSISFLILLVRHLVLLHLGAFGWMRRNGLTFF